MCFVGRIVFFVALLAAELGWSEEQVVVVSPHWEGIRYEFGTLFEEQERRTGREVRVVWRDVGGTAEMVRFVHSEFHRSPGGIGVDAVFGGGTESFLDFAAAGFLEPIREADAQILPVALLPSGAPLIDRERRWIAVTISSFGIVCNLEVLRRLGLSLPERWEDLTAPGFASWVASADPRRSGSMHLVYEMLLQGYGWQEGWRLIHRIAAHLRNFSSHSTQVSKDVAAGEAACGFSLDSQAFAQIEEFGPERIAFVLPEGKSVLTGDAVALMRGGVNRSVAERFIRFLLSREAQRLWLYQRGVEGGPKRFSLNRHSVLPELYETVPGRSAVTLNPFTVMAPFQYDAELGGERWGMLNDLLDVFVIRPHERLIELRNQVAAGTLSEREWEEVTTIPVTEAESLRLIREGTWGNPMERATFLNRWGQERGQLLDRFLGSPSPTNRWLALVVVLAVFSALCWGWLRRWLT